jgi:hypothetical protein
MTVKYYGEIAFTMDENHSDIAYVNDWAEDKVFTFEDTYSFKADFVWGYEDGVIEYIKRDLMLVAGGGYNTDHIHNVTFTIERI